MPWYRLFRGEIEQNPKSGYIIKGKYEVDEADFKVEINELPVGKWTRDYKNFIEELMTPAEGKEPLIEEMIEKHKDYKLKFVLQIADGKFEAVTKGIFWVCKGRY